MPRRIRYEQDAEIKRKGNTDYLKTDAQSKDGWRPIRTFNTSTGEWRLTALGKRYYADVEGLPEVVLRLPVVFDTYKAGRGNVQHEGWFPYELLDIELRQRLEAVTLAGGADRAARNNSFQAKILVML